MIRAAIIGVGNCASSLVQAISADQKGLLNTGVNLPTFGPYRIRDIYIVASFDVDERKVGCPLDQAIFTTPNCTTRYFEVPPSSVLVSVGPLLDGLAEYMLDTVHPDHRASKVRMDDVVGTLTKAKAEILISYLPVGAHQAAAFYAEAALQAHCAFINCMPTPIAGDKKFSNAFLEAGLPLLGDDIKSQIGSTAIHRALIGLLEQKGIHMTSTYQLNVGGNTDFKNMRYPERSVSKRHSKEAALKHLFHKQPPALGVGPSDQIPHLHDFKVAYINIEGKAFLGMPFSVELRLKVEDSPNSAGVVVDAVRAAKVALDRHIGGIIEMACPALFKNPPTSLPEPEAISNLFRFAEVA